MRLSETSPRARFLGQVAAVALLAGLSAGCSADVDRFGGFGSLFEPTDNRAGIVQGDAVVTGSVAPAPTTAVTSGALPPPVAVAPIQPAPAGQGWSPAPAPVAAAPSLAAPAPVAAAAPAPAGQQGVAEVYVVKPGDSLGRIANDRGFRSIEVATFNGIDPTAPIKVGQQLRIPAAGAKPVQVAAATPAATGTMTDGQTLGQITVPQPVPPALPQPTAAAAPAQQPTPAAPAEPQPQATQTAAVQPQTQTNPQVTTGTGVESSASGSFRWPVRGRVVSAYGVKANGQRNDGINIEVPEGTPIKAAEGGTVIYAGSELKGYGNLVLIKHPNGYVSAYAHASELLVKRDDVIMRGQTIGKVGATGNVDRPQLHFEIRQGNKPVDPLPYLSG